MDISKGLDEKTTRDWLPVEIVHWIAGVTGNLVQALTSAYSLLNSILIVHYFIIC